MEKIREMFGLCLFIKTSPAATTFSTKDKAQEFLLMTNSSVFTVIVILFFETNL